MSTDHPTNMQQVAAREHAPEETQDTRAHPKVVFGAMVFGDKGAEAVRVSDVDEAARMLDILQGHGHHEIDTARAYGSSEAMLGQLKWQSRGLAVGTKLTPKYIINAPKDFKPYTHNKEGLERGLTDSLAALDASSHTVPYAVTFEAVHDLYQTDRFERFGISNYSSWEVAQICEMCDRYGWKKPDVYQAAYHALQRNVESELLPCLRHYNIAFYAFSPLAGGLLSAKYQRDTEKVEEGSRFDPERIQGRNFRQRYWNDAYFDALDVIRAAALEIGIETAVAVLRWTRHHSALDGSKGDALIIGASSPAQLQQNLEALEQGPLPASALSAFERAWAIAMHASPPYSR